MFGLFFTFFFQFWLLYLSPKLYHISILQFWFSIMFKFNFFSSFHMFFYLCVFDCGFFVFWMCVVTHIFLLNFFIFDLSLLFIFKNFQFNFSVMIFCFVFLTWFIFCFLNIIIGYFHVHSLYFIPTVQFNFDFDFLNFRFCKSRC